MSSEKPILFSGPMIRALDAGRKTQTRRVVKLTDSGHIKEVGSNRRWHPDDPNAILAAPYPVGTKLWVRETWALNICGYDRIPKERPIDFNGEPADIVYRADGELRDQFPEDFGEKKLPWRPGIHMPRWASRYTLEVTDVRLERLQEISVTDIKAEGVTLNMPALTVEFGLDVEARACFSALWDSIHGPGAWDRNPWVWAYTFKRLDPR